MGERDGAQAGDGTARFEGVTRINSVPHWFVVGIRVGPGFDEDAIGVVDEPM